MFRPHSRALIAATAAFGLAVLGAAPAVAAQPTDEPSAQETAHAALARQTAGEGMVLLDNAGGALPVPLGNVAVFGVGGYKTVKGGTGSGDVNNRYMIASREGLAEGGYTVTTSDAYWDAMVTQYDTLNPGGGGGFGFGGGVDYAGSEVALTVSSVQPSSPTTTAIYVLPRNSGEGSDRTATKGDYYLTDTELANITLIGQTYEKVAVVLNVGAVVDTVFVEQINARTTDPAGGRAIDSLLLMSQAGQESGRALFDIVSGAVNPSGKTVDTWASEYSYYPASAIFAGNDGVTVTENYPEGIYVGYRYFDSFYKSINRAAPASVVSYPFGYGGSYTSFTVSPGAVSANADAVTVQATVSNTGTVAGKEVVQVYFSAPTTGLDKPYQELAAYAKTDLLAPGKSQTLTLSFPTTEMSSYDEAAAAYTLEAGTYAIRVGTSSRDTSVAAKLTVASNVITERLAGEVNDERTLNATQLTSNPADFYTYPGEAAQIAAAPTVPADFSGFIAPNNASQFEQTVAVPSTSAFYELDGSTIAATTALIDAANAGDWEGTGAAYAPKEGETVQQVTVTGTPTLFDVAKGTATMDQFVASLSVTQLANIVEGASLGGSTLSANGAAGYTTSLYEALGIAQMSLSDGPAGLRLTQQWTDAGSGADWYQFCTAWPIGTMLAQTWNTDLIEDVGTAIGEEMVTYGATLWLAPGQNIHRDPLNGRNFEYFSEDPLVTGLTSTAETLGVQSNAGVGVTLKHYAGNNQETSRSGGNSVINERALREIYLKGFEIAVKSAQPMSVMSSYNQINGHCVAGDYDLLTNILRGEWGFDGTVMTDWGGCGSLLGNMYAGNDLIEPGGAAASVIQSLLAVEPTVDLFGLPAITANPAMSFPPFFFMPATFALSLGNAELSATGDHSRTTLVDSSIIGESLISGTVLGGGGPWGGGTVTPMSPFTSVQEAYDFVDDLMTGGNPLAFEPTDSAVLSPDQQAAITVGSETYGAGGALETFSVTFRYGFFTPMRLGDVQRNAARILATTMRSAPFEELAAIQGVSGISVGSYTAQYSDLAQYVTAGASAITNAVLDTATLDAAIAAAEAAAGAATTGSVESSGLAGVIAAARAAKTAAVTQADIIAAQTALDAGVSASGSALVPRGNPAVLSSVAAAAQALNSADYTAASWATLLIAVTSAQAVLANPASASQAVIDQAASSLVSAISTLEIVPAEPLDNGGDDGDDGKDQGDDKDQGDGGDRTGGDSGLNAATEQARGAQAALQSLVDAVATLVQADYTADTWAGAASAVTAARAVLANPAATTAQVQQASQALAKALAGLVAPAPQTPQPPLSGAVVAVKAGQKSVVLVKGTKIKIAAKSYTDAGIVGPVAWKSSKKSVATVTSAGTITAKRAGKATITVTAGGKTASVKVTVLAKKPKAKVTSVSASVPKTLTVGSAASVTGSYKSASAAKVKVTYTSSAPAIASIDTAGRLVAKAAGTAKITVKAGSKSKSYTVTVS
ncbi:MAG: glycoside hydrolase family 3 C-terminal domain-containing protein [Bifidobacteriaceae bacterium]|nr:glycoside hydrolase family 3 C-terminal domain-containing protein [Bifidobacteriaceae bacterium]